MNEMRKLMETVESAQAANPVDTITVDVPLLIRLLEFSREDAQTDMDLHQLAASMINLSPESNTLTMADYEELVTGLAGHENAEGPYQDDEDENDDDPSDWDDMSDNMRQLARQGR